MAKYFSKFPKIYYSLVKNNYPLEIVTNIITRFGIEKSVKNNALIYNKYSIKDGDTPEIIAAKLYDSPERHWIVLLANDIVDVESEWPLQQNALIKYINSKYSTDIIEDGISWAKLNIHSYYKRETITLLTENNSKTIKEFEIDSNTYTDLVESYGDQYTLSDGNVITIDITKRTKSYYDYENELNENKRNIKLFRREFVTTLEEQLKSIFNENI